MGQQWNHLKYTNHYKQWNAFLEELKQLQGPIETVTIPPDKSHANDSAMQVYSSPFSTQANMAMNASFMPTQSNSDTMNAIPSNFTNYNSYNNNCPKPVAEKKSSPLQIAVKVIGIDIRMKTASRTDNSCIILSSETITCDGLIEDDCDVSESCWYDDNNDNNDNDDNQ